MTFAKKDLPFLLGGAGEIAVDIGDLSPDQAAKAGAGSLLSVSFNAGGDQKIRLGQTDTVKLSLSAGATASLSLIFPTSTGAAAARLTTCGLDGFFKGGANADKVVLAFEAGASVDAAVSNAFTYSALAANVEVDVGADAGYAYVRALDKTIPVGQLLGQYFKGMRLPEQTAPTGKRAPEPGEAITLRYGGYLKLGAEVSAGYRLSGTKALSIGGLALSERYDLSVIGKIGLTAGVAGRFSILLAGADGLPGWARVQVRRHRARDLKIAADVNVGFKNKLDHLPATADEFLGAALGVQAKNFLNVFQKAREFSDLEGFEGAIDGLAARFVSEFVGQAFESLAAQPAFSSFLHRVNNVVTSYERVENCAVALFDRYFDNPEELTKFLEKIASLDEAGFDTLRKDLNAQTWNMLAQLTDGDTLGFVARQAGAGGSREEALAEVKRRARATLDLVQQDAHADLRRVISLAKTGFGVDDFFSALAKIDTVEELEAVADEKIGQFVTRLVGHSLDSSPNVKQAFKEVRAVLDHIDVFKNKLFDAFKAATNSSYRAALHAEYSRASENDALVDALVNLDHPQGPELLAQAGKGDFEELLTSPDTTVVRLREGVLTHRTQRGTAFNVNILGWHLNYRYEGFDRVITETDQRLVPSEHGLTVLTTATLEIDRARKRRDEEVHVNFLLRALGSSAKAVKTAPGEAAFVVDALTSLAARYELAFTDADTSPSELRDYLAFANDVGLAARGATFSDLEPLLPRAPNGGFGRVKASYEVRFGARAVAALIGVKAIPPKSEAAIRQTMRQMVLSNYLRSEELHDVAFAYATPAVFDVFNTEGVAFANRSERAFPIDVALAGIAAPRNVALDRLELNVLATLYNIENSVIDAIKALYKVLNADSPMAPDVFEKKLGAFGDALKNFDQFDQTTSKHGIGVNTIFAVFDAMVRLASAGDPANISVLRLKSDANGREVEKLFLSDAAADRN